MLGLCGCTAHIDFAKRPIGPVGTYTHKQELNGLQVAIDPMTNATEVAQVFGIDLLAKDMLPVLVVATNQNSTVSYVVSPERFTLLNGQHASGRKSEAAGTGGSEAAGWTVAVLGIGPTLIAAPFLVHSVDKALVINQNLRCQQLLQMTLSPGEGTYGFVYFTIPKEKRRERAWTLSVRTLELPSRAEKEIVFPYNW